jgi:hypothetical protein
MTSGRLRERPKYIFVSFSIPASPLISGQKLRLEERHKVEPSPSVALLTGSRSNLISTTSVLIQPSTSPASALGTGGSFQGGKYEMSNNSPLFAMLTSVRGRGARLWHVAQPVRIECALREWKTKANAVPFGVADAYVSHGAAFHRNCPL